MNKLEIIPAVDLRNGKCARLVRGKAGTEKYYGDPVEALHDWENRGAERVHVIDLDATLGLGDNLELIRTLVEGSTAKIQVGGGIRTIERAVELVGAGVDRVIVGTMAVKHPEKVGELSEAVGSEHVVVALDHVGGKIAIKGWTETTELDAFEFARELEGLGAGFVLMTSVEGDGTFQGPDLESTRRMVRETSIPVIAAGGIGSLDDVVALREAGVAGVVIGKALYENKFTLEDALKI
ncbi:MAG: 1-(5-phosphoribosyl)-5-[(5-phosphoribosylamino)methylideneamino]imidazole-4-carboxamide isomerase [Promethearchaeota archaeon]